MSHRSKVSEGAQSFLSPELLKKRASDWKKASIDQEPAAKNGDSKLYDYIVDRRENSKGDDGIQELHGESFIQKVIPAMIEKLEVGRKLKILDVGAGAALYTDQIRQTFGERVKVFSTGISKQATRKVRKLDGHPRLNKNDLKWRSIEQLSAFPEFHLIIDTFGEQAYRTNQPYDANWVSNHKNLEKLFLYVRQVVAKLASPGYASLAPIKFNLPLMQTAFLNTIKNSLGVDAYWGGLDDQCLKIVKT